MTIYGNFHEASGTEFPYPNPPFSVPFAVARPWRCPIMGLDCFGSSEWPQRTARFAAAWSTFKKQGIWSIRR